MIALAATSAPGTVATAWLRNLRPAAAAPESASTAATVADAVDRIGPGPVEWACEVGGSMATRIIGEIPELGGGTEQFDTLRMGTESSAIRSLLWISELADSLSTVSRIRPHHPPRRHPTRPARLPHRNRHRQHQGGRRGGFRQVRENHALTWR
ncbi:hypothetical protein ACFVKB_44835 [Rhodococcus sp. NPDC127530]|uniref:hypothetical protein n=1 Tax=unclassified Rhodococcus (in: high G+C Gram-positive bacteria) TaxID=192944 RepID=UPI00363A679F